MSDTHDGFLRQRRSLFATTLVLLVVVFFGLDGTALRLGPGSGTGLSVNLERTGYIYVGLYTLWVWFLYRYVQYRNPTNDNAARALRTSKHEKLKEKLQDVLEAKIVEELATRVESGDLHDTNAVLTKYEVERRGTFGWHPNRRVTQRLWVKLTFRNSDGLQKVVTRNGEAELSGKSFRIRQMWALWRHNLMHPYYADRPPFWVFVIPVVLMTAFRWRELVGSFFPPARDGSSLTLF